MLSANIYPSFSSLEEKNYQYTRGEKLLTLVAILFTFLAAFFSIWEVLKRIEVGILAGNPGESFSLLIFLFLILFLLYGGLVYLFGRYLHIKRVQKYAFPETKELDRFLQNPSLPDLTILIPSYKEDEEVVAKTILSALLQNYPNKRIVLLIDDSPNPQTEKDQELLEASRNLPLRFCRLWQDFQSILTESCVDSSKESLLTSEKIDYLYHNLQKQIQQWITLHSSNNHLDQFFIDKILVKFLEYLELRKLNWKSCSGLDNEKTLWEYNYLKKISQVSITCFERKLFTNLSHEPSKAMNLNSYIGLMGKRYSILEKSNTLVLQETDKVYDLEVPDSEYLITLDADSLIFYDYATKLIYLAQQSGNERIAVFQTPYSAIPNPSKNIEKIAGATTDIQYIIHQGFQCVGSVYWVGANALLRKKALDEIVTFSKERGYIVPRYIHNHTVIEDTESSIDLVLKNWQLYNYPERLAYSATPDDFGSLVIQRRRWANGGLIILPKFYQYLRRKSFQFSSIYEGLMRLHYLVSLTTVNFGLLVLLSFPFSSSLSTKWLLLTAVPYYYCYARDLYLMGYKIGDIFRVYALNLLLIPVNIMGILKSLRQAITKQKSRFHRTPKIRGRTSVAAIYLVFEFLLIFQWGYGGFYELQIGNSLHGFFAVTHSIILLYAVIYFIGIYECYEDLKASFYRQAQVVLQNFQVK